MCDFLSTQGIICDLDDEDVCLRCKLDVPLNANEFNGLVELYHKLTNLNNPSPNSKLYKWLVFEFSTKDNKLRFPNRMPLLAFFKKSKLLVEVVPSHTEKPFTSGDLSIFQFPNDKILAYYGSQVVFYFEFLQSYARWLAGLILVYLVLGGVMKTEQIILIWSLTFPWFGMSRKSVNPSVSQEHFFAFPQNKNILIQRLWRLFSATVLIISTFLISFSLILFLESDFLKGNLYNERARMVLYTLSQTIVIKTFDKISVRLTTWERHDNDNDFEMSRIVKIILMRVVIALNFPVYIMFVRKQTHKTESVDMLKSLVSTAFTTNQVTGSIGEMVPSVYFILKKETRKRKRIERERKTEFVMKPWEGQTWNVSDEYLEMVMQFFTLTTFGQFFLPAYPLALINNILEYYLDGQKLINSKRNFPSLVDSQGHWRFVFKMISIISGVLMLKFMTIRNSIDAIEETIINQDYYGSSSIITDYTLISLSLVSLVISSLLPSKNQMQE